MPNSRVQSVIDLTTNTTVAAGHWGGILTNNGATTTITITLPTASSTTTGAWVDVFVTQATSVVVATATTDTLAVDGDAAADSIAWQTSSHQIGNGARFINAGSIWMCKLNPAATSTTLATQTIVTA